MHTALSQNNQASQNIPQFVGGLSIIVLTIPDHVLLCITTRIIRIIAVTPESHAQTAYA